MIGFMIIGGIVNSRLKSKFKKYSIIPTISGMSGKEIAEKMLTDNGINDVKVVSVNTLLQPLKKRRVGKFIGAKSRYKRAIVTIAPEDSITLFEDA